MDLKAPSLGLHIQISWLYMYKYTYKYILHDESHKKQGGLVSFHPMDQFDETT